MPLSFASNTTETRLRRLPQLLLFAGFAAWYFGSDALASRAASGFSFRFGLGLSRGLIEAIFHLFLLVLGFIALAVVARQVVPLRELVALPARDSASREWGVGVAVGWALVVGSLLPLILSARLHMRIDWSGRGAVGMLLTLAVVGVASLVHEITFRGYPFRCLIGAVGPSSAVILMMLGSGFSAWRSPYTPRAGILAAALLTLVLSLGWLRTHGVWLSWGLHFALVASTGVVFGMPVAGSEDLSSMIRGSAYGPDWLTGGEFGPAAALFSLLMLVAGVVLVMRVTREYAWSYTHAPIVAAGYEVMVAPPAAHTAMEQAAKAPALVQILSSAPQGISAERLDGPVPPPPIPDRLH